MKNILLVLWTAVFAAGLQAQTMRVHTNAGLQEFSLSDIDSITFGQTTTTYVAEFTAADEDFVGFGPLPGFTYNTSWSVIEKVQLPLDKTATSG